MSFFHKSSFKTLLVSGVIATILCVYLLLNNLLHTQIQRINAPTEIHSKEHQLLDLPDFKYIINNNLCSPFLSNTTVKVVLIVTSFAGNVKERSKIRQSYPNSLLNNLGIHRVFLLALLQNNAYTNEDTTIYQNDLVIENKRFSDLVQGSFIEAYRNLTYKHVMGLQWAVSYCKEAQYIIKMDDDIAVDFYQLLELLKPRANPAKETLLMGYILHGLLPVRDKESKWFVTRKEYAKSLYPPFLSGWLYITTLTTAQVLVNASKRMHFFWIDDTFVTGMLAKVAGIKHKDISDKFAVHPEYLECCLEGSQSNQLACDFVVGPLGGDYGLFHRFQKHAAHCHRHKCPKRLAHKSLTKTCVTRGKVTNLGRGRANVLPYSLF